MKTLRFYFLVFFFWGGFSSDLVANLPDYLDAIDESFKEKLPYFSPDQKKHYAQYLLTPFMVLLREEREVCRRTIETYWGKDDITVGINLSVYKNNHKLVLLLTTLWFEKFLENPLPDD